MSVFRIMDRQADSLGESAADGKVVLSRLATGESLIGAPTASLKLVLDGEETYAIDGRSVRVEPGQFVFVDAGDPCVAHNRGVALGLCLYLPVRTDAAPVDPLLGRTVLFSAEASPIGRLLLDAGAALARKPDAGFAVAGDLVQAVMAALEGELFASRTAMNALKATKPSTRRELYARLVRARGYLHDVTMRPVPLQELAVKAGLSQFHLARYFKDAFGLPPAAYHRRLRLDLAVRLLSKRDSNLSDVALMTGYSDASSLSHALTKRRRGR